MGTRDQQLRDALGSAAEAMWDDEGPQPDIDRRRRRLRIGLGAGVAMVVVAVALVVAVLGNGPAPTRSATGHPSRSLRTAAPTKQAPIKGTSSSGGTQNQFAAGAPGEASGAGGVTEHGAPSNSTQSSPGSTSSSVPALPSGIVGQNAKVEMTGSANLRVARHGLSGALAALTNMAVGNGGYVASSSVQTGSPAPVPEPQASTSSTAPSSSDGPAPSADLTLEIPVAAYQGVVNRLGTVGAVTSLSTHAADVTGQYTDLQARITALQASRQQYLTIMTQATTISDILAVQSQIDQLQSQIEQLQGQLNLLTSQTTYGTLALSVFEAGARAVPRQHPQPSSGVSRAWHDAVGGFLAGVDGIVRISGPLLFAVLCILVLIAAVLGLRRLFKQLRGSHG